MSCLPIFTPFLFTDLYFLLLVKNKCSELKILVNSEFAYCVIMQRVCRILGRVNNRMSRYRKTGSKCINVVFKVIFLFHLINI